MVADVWEDERKQLTSATDWSATDPAKDEAFEVTQDGDSNLSLDQVREDTESAFGELNLDEDADSKLDLARAYVEMGSNDEPKAKLQEVIAEGTDAEIKEANELLAKLD